MTHTLTSTGMEMAELALEQRDDVDGVFITLLYAAVGIERPFSEF